MVKQTLSGLGLTGFWPLGDSTWKPDMDANLQILSALVQRVVKSRVTTLPGTPTAGDIYIVPTGAGSNPNKLAVWGWNPATEAAEWVYIVPAVGWVFHVTDTVEDVRWDGTDWNINATAGGGGGSYDVGISFGGTPLTDEVMGRVSVPREVTLPANLVGSAGHVATNPTAIFVVTVKDDGADIGTLSIGVGGVFTFATVGGTEKVVAAGSLVTFHAQTTVDATLADVSATLLGAI